MFASRKLQAWNKQNFKTVVVLIGQGLTKLQSISKDDRRIGMVPSS